jgi:hypothetical protein
MSSVVGSKTHGFLVTDEGRLFVAFANAPDPNGERKHGLYELKATPGSRIASLTAVDGTVTAFDSRVVIAFAGRRTSESQRLFAEMARRGPCTASTERVTLPIMRNRLRGRKPGRWMTRRAAGTFADDLAKSQIRVANSLCLGWEKRTMSKPKTLIGNSN